MGYSLCATVSNEQDCHYHSNRQGGVSNAGATYSRFMCSWWWSLLGLLVKRSFSSSLILCWSEHHCAVWTYITAWVLSTMCVHRVPYRLPGPAIGLADCTSCSRPLLPCAGQREGCQVLGGEGINVDLRHIGSVLMDIYLAARSCVCIYCILYSKVSWANYVFLPAGLRVKCAASWS